MKKHITLPPIEIMPKIDAKRSIIWLHGLGADGNDFVPMAQELNLPEELGIRFVFPHAPIMPITLNGGYEMRAWYDISSTLLDTRIDTQGIARSMKEIEKLIVEEENRGIPTKNILLAGFSQGAAMALTTGLKYKKPLAGIIALSGYLPPDNDIPQPSYPLPIFIGHGTFDPIVPIQLGKKAATLLKDLHYDVTWQSYPMPHTVCLDEIKDISAWIKNIFAGNGSTSTNFSLL